MANKLAGQRAKFSRARAIFYTASDQSQRDRAAQLMAEVIAEAPANGFSEEDVTQGADVPSEARQLAAVLDSKPAEEDPDELVNELLLSVDASNVLEVGEGIESVYAYGYRCAPDRIKIGSCAGDVIARIAAQISTATPDKPVLLVTIRTHDCRVLERTLHGIFRLKGRQVKGAGAEWFIATADEVVAAYEKVLD